MITRDGGATWEDRKPGSQFDAHAIATHHAAPERVYEAAGGGVAHLGRRRPYLAAADDGMDRHYTWGLAVDAADPDLWYVSAASGRGRRTAATATRGYALSQRGDAPWEALTGVAPGSRPLPYMPYALWRRVVAQTRSSPACRTVRSPRDRGRWRDVARHADRADEPPRVERSRGVGLHVPNAPSDHALS